MKAETSTELVAATAGWPARIATARASGIAGNAQADLGFVVARELRAAACFVIALHETKSERHATEAAV